MRIFDTNVQLLKYNVLKEVIKRAYDGRLNDAYIDIAKSVSPGPKAKLRCCIYKERAVTQERIKLAMGGNKENPNVIEVIDIACDECPVEAIFVTPACRGCIVHACVESCPRDAITIIDKKAVVDKEKCIECGKCIDACPYNAIISQRRPCIVSCKVKAISIDENKKAVIDDEKCIQCGACVYQCPFGAISDKSFVLDIVDILKQSKNNTAYKVYAVVAPAIASQYPKGRPGQIVTSIKKLGFYEVVEAALGADITLYKEAQEFREKGLMTTSCCPSFVMYIEKNFPDLVQYISHSPSPMIEAARLIKKADPTAKVIFIGPCSSKKTEFRLEKTGGAIDSVMSFEELQAFVDAFDIDISQCEDSELDNASFYGRIFAKSGGVTKGISDLAKEMKIDNLRPITMDGIKECRKTLLRLRSKKIDANFFEGMACEGGCVNGALAITHMSKNVVNVDKFAEQAQEKTIHKSVELYEKIESENK